MFFKVSTGVYFLRLNKGMFAIIIRTSPPFSCPVVWGQEAEESYC
jgi:hypothetical protein